MSNGKICLCIVFNHPFPDNIDLLEKIYRHRFPDIRYLIPFHRDPNNPDVIPVYRGSYVHQGFATDASFYLREVECSHYVFLQDDVLLNPRLTANNILSRLEVGPAEGFINQMSSVKLDAGGWHWILGILWKLFYPRNQLSGTGVDSIDTIFKYLPNLDQAFGIMSRYGIDLPVITRNETSLSDTSVVRDIPYFGTRDSTMVRQMNQLVMDSLFATAPDPSRIEIPYPFAMSAWGADFFIVPKNAFEMYQHYSGVLAAAGTFAEISVATSLALTACNVVTAAGKPYKFDWIWTADRERQAEELALKLGDPDMIAVHPVKLSLLKNDPLLLSRIFHRLNDLDSEVE